MFSCLLFIRSICLRGITLAVGALTANFLSSSEGDPPLLYHDEVVSLFREFGKLMGYLCVEVSCFWM